MLYEPGGPEALLLETVPGPGQVVVQVAHCGVCFHDVVVRNGTLKAGIRMPLIPGHEIAGIIAACGAGVSAFRVGERVATIQRAHVCGRCRYCRTGREPLCAESVFLGDMELNGGYAEYVVLDADSVVRVPDGVAMRDAAITACAIGTAFHAIIGIGQVRPSDTVLITGASGEVGIHAVQIARAKDFSAEVRELTGGAGVEVAIDNVGTLVFQAVRRSLARGGRWTLVGQLTGDFVSFNPAQLFLKGISMLSSTSVTREELRRCLHLLAQGTIRAVVEGSVPLAEAAQAHRRLESGAVSGRLTLVPGP